MKNQICTIYVARHGETDWNLKGLLQGQADIHMNSNGIKQADLLGVKLKNVKFDAIFSSDLSRAVKTAEIVALEMDLIVKTTHYLREKSFGKFEGKEREIFQNELKEYSDKFAKLSSDEKVKYKFPTMESDEEVISRFITFIREVAIGYKGKNVLVVTHGTLIGNFLIHLGLFTYENRYTRRINNTGYLVLESDGVNFFVKEADGIDITI